MTKDLTKAAACFAADTELEAVHQTSDGFCFPTDAAAAGHAKTLTDNKVAVIKRSEAKLVDAVADKVIVPLESGLVKLKAFADSIGVDASTCKSKADVIALIEAKQAETAKEPEGEE